MEGLVDGRKEKMGLGVGGFLVIVEYRYGCIRLWIDRGMYSWEWVFKMEGRISGF